jgi:hypothetical protein
MKKKGSEEIPASVGSPNSAKLSSMTQKLAALKGEGFSKVAQQSDMVNDTVQVVLKYPGGVIGMCVQFAVLHIEVVQYFNGELLKGEGFSKVAQ